MALEIAEALAAANVAPLIQKNIDTMLLEYQRRYSPLIRTIPTVKWDATDYYFNRRDARPNGGFVPDGGARPITNSTYVQQSFKVKLMQTVGSITGFAQAVTRAQIGDLKQKEIDGSMQSLIWDMDTATVWGNAGATLAGQQPQFDGLDYLVSNWTAGSGSSNFVNALDQAGASLLLRHLDLLIDLVETNAAMPVDQSGWAFVMSPTAQSKVAQQLTNQQRFNDRVEVAAGLLTPSYRGIPILKDSFLSARTQTMGAVTTSTATTGGTQAAGTRNYRVGAVIARFGEIAASASVAQATTGTTSTTSLAITTPTGPDSAPPILYKVYATAIGGAAGTETLLGTVDAFDTTGAATVTIIDTGTNLLTNNAGNTGPAGYQNTNAGASPRSASYEDIYIIPIDENFLVRPYVRDLTPLNVYPGTAAPDTLPYAIVTDTCVAVRAPKYVGRLSRVTASL